MDTEIVLHPSRNFLDARNPSSPFQYRMQMCMNIWWMIENSSFKPKEGWVSRFHIKINEKWYIATSKKELFNKIFSDWFAIKITQRIK